MPALGLPHAAAGGTVSLPLTYRRGAPHARLEARAHARNGRRLQQQPAQLVHAGLSGDLVSRGYFSAELYVGTPPQRFSVIVDTGSSVTAIACTGCARCGRHSNPRFVPSSSATFEAVSCASGQCTTCWRHTSGLGIGSDVCGYRVSYQEGSHYSGYLARDVVSLGIGSDECATLYLEFGCSTDESGLFKSQQADGIMGLASSASAHAGWSDELDGQPPKHEPPSGGGRTVLEALVHSGYVEDAFSVCIGATHGVLTFGLPPQLPATDWTAVADAFSYYTVNVLAVSYGGTRLSRDSLPSNSIVDSGTTFMYLHSAAFAPLLHALRRASSHCPRLTPSPSTPDDEFCVQMPSERVSGGHEGSGREVGGPAAALDGCFSNISVALQGGTLSMPPSQYFYESGEPNEWCIGVFDNYDDSLVLGAINMMNHQVTFDRAGQRIGFSPADCSRMHLESQRARNASQRGLRGRHLRSSSRASEHACRAAHHHAPPHPTMLRGVGGGVWSGGLGHGAAFTSWLHAISAGDSTSLGEITARYAAMDGMTWQVALLLAAALGCLFALCFLPPLRSQRQYALQREQARRRAPSLPGGRLRHSTSGMLSAAIARAGLSTWSGLGRSCPAARSASSVAAWAGTDEDEDEDASSDHFLLLETERPAMADARYGQPSAREA